MSPITVNPNPELNPQSDPGPTVRERVEDTVREAKEKFGQSMAQARETVEQKAREAQKTIQDRAKQAREVMEEKAQETRQKVGVMYQKVQEEMGKKTLEELLEDGRLYVRNHPMKSLGAAVVVGLLVGRLLRRR
jgi:ElaB/YqjD/DUF883 family membrane-anchored ribosome-binding protein